MPAMSGRVLVIGSINVDLVVTAPRLPMPGETVLGGSFRRHFGGKGANQAVAARRAGAQVTMLGAVGRDTYGDESLADLSAEGVDVRHVGRVDAATGLAVIAVDADGQNQIVVAPGANAALGAEHVTRALERTAPDVLLASLEVPMEAVARAVLSAAAVGALVVVNPAPAAELPLDLLAAGPVLTPNRSELALVGGAPELETAVERLRRAGARGIVVTLGAGGAIAYDGDDVAQLPPLAVPEVLDTTGAGDAFSGVLAAWLAEGRALREAAAAANVAAGLSVQGPGARGGMPTRERIEAALRDHAR